MTGSSVSTGSSPLARGTPDDYVGDPGRRRLIPARAGNTCRRGESLLQAPAHPRSRGEHPAPSQRDYASCGSSPLARGTLIEGAQEAAVKRLIPARAGNTDTTEGSSTVNPAHPRSRGEHTWEHVGLFGIPGSSPLARGTLQDPPASFVSPRLIPARAGNTCRPYACSAGDPAHPRSRGEHPLAVTTENVRLGSSPLARGTPA